MRSPKWRRSRSHDPPRGARIIPGAYRRIEAPRGRVAVVVLRRLSSRGRSPPSFDAGETRSRVPVFRVRVRTRRPERRTMTEDRPRHPFDPLTADEVARAWSLVRAQDGQGPRVRVVSIALAEPPRAALRAPGADHPVERAAFVVLMDRD